MVQSFGGALLAATLAVTPISAQQTGAIHGRVVDARTGAGLEKVLVLIEDGGPSTLTDGAGAFELPQVVPGLRRLYVSVVGYSLVRRDVQIVAGTALDVTVPLSEGTGTYTEAVTVAADRFRPGETAVASQQVLGSADIQNLRGVLADDPLRAVQVLPGVATGDDLRSEFSVRGSDFTHMNLTVEGFASPFLLHTVRAVEDQSASGSVAMINSDILEDVTLLNGGYAQRYGDRTGAEVDFRLREGSRERRQTRVAVSGTSASVVGEGPLGGARKGSWLVSARQSYLDLVVSRVFKDGEGVSFGFSDAQAKLVYDLTPSQHAELVVIAGRSKLKELAQDLDATDFFLGHNRSVIGVGTWRVTRPRAIVTSRMLASVNRFNNETTVGVDLDRGHDNQIAGRIDASFTASAAVQLDAGVQGERTDETRMRQRFSGSLGRFRLINDLHGRGTRTGGYVQARWTAGPVTLVPGVRADRWSVTGESRASPWLQGDWKISPSLAVRGGAGIYRQFPNFDQAIGALGDPAAAAQRAEQYDLGLERRLSPSMRLQLTVYDREEDGFFRRAAAETRLDPVTGRVVRGSPSAPYRPSLEGYARGVELLFQRKSTSGLSGWLAYSFGRNRYTDRDTHETYWSDLDQRHTLNLYVFYRLSDRMSLSGKLRAGSNIPAPGYYAQRDGQYYVASTRNDVRLPTYSRVDVRANRTFNWSRKRLTLFAEVMNVFNRDNVRYNPPGVNTTTGRVSPMFETMIPIIPSAGILIEF